MLIGDRDCVSFCHLRLCRTSENLPYFPGYVMMSENLSYFPGFTSRDLMNSENLYYFPGFMLIGDRDCVSSCHFRLSRTSENLPYFPGSVMNGYHDCVLH